MSSSVTGLDLFPIFHHICLSYTRAFFKREQWPLLIVDEGHRLKNPKCQLMAMLRRLQTNSRFLLTGTPVQNNMSEMWSLMNFLLPEIFDEPVRISSKLILTLYLKRKPNCVHSFSGNFRTLLRNRCDGEREHQFQRRTRTFSSIDLS